jgi:uncharacterized protein (TIGR02246 family)
VSPAEEAVVLSVLDAARSAWANNDADGFAALYADDATIVLPGIYHDGRAAIRQYTAFGFTGPFRNTRPVDIPQKVRIIRDGTAIVVSESVILLPGEDDAPRDRYSRATWVLTKRDGRWLIDAYHNSPVQ